MARPSLRVAAVPALLVAEAAVVVTLHRLGEVDGFAGPGLHPAAWLSRSDPETVVAGGLRWVSLACAWWLLLSTASYAIARALHLGGLAGALGRTTLPGARRIVDGALAVCLTAGVVGGAHPAPAGPPPGPPPSSAPPLDRRPHPLEPAPAPEIRDGRAPELPAPASPPTPSSSPTTPPPPTVPAPLVHVVAPGESLWTIAATRLGATTGRDPASLTPAAIGPYWARMVAATRDGLRSGNPNLIHPGEVLELPAP